MEQQSHIHMEYIHLPTTKFFLGGKKMEKVIPLHVGLGLHLHNPFSNRLFTFSVEKLLSFRVALDENNVSKSTMTLRKLAAPPPPLLPIFASLPPYSNAIIHYFRYLLLTSEHQLEQKTWWYFLFAFNTESILEQEQVFATSISYLKQLTFSTCFFGVRVSRTLWISIPFIGKKSFLGESLDFCILQTAFFHSVEAWKMEFDESCQKHFGLHNIFLTSGCMTVFEPLSTFVVHFPPTLSHWIWCLSVD